VEWGLLMADRRPINALAGPSMQATPRKNALAGYAADALGAVDQFARKPFGYDNPPAALASDFLSVPAIQRTLERLSYGEPLTTGKGMTTRMRDDTVDAAMAAAPVVAKWPKQALGAAGALVGAGGSSSGGLASSAAAKIPDIPPNFKQEILKKWHKMGQEVRDAGFTGSVEDWNSIVWGGHSFPHGKALEELANDTFGAPVTRAFFENGMNGLDAPYYARGYRLGDLPPGNISRNHQAGTLERGVSLMSANGSEPTGNARMFEAMNPGRNKIDLEGWVVGVGSDGEPIMINPRIIK